jgi:hypothetical protein
MTAHYNRSDIVSFYELTIEQQEEALKTYDYEGIQDEQFVVCSDVALPLSSFIRLTQNNVWHGAYGMTVWSAYFIKLDKNCSQAVVAYKYW